MNAGVIVAAGVYASVSEAERAAHKLLSSGFGRSQVLVLSSPNQGAQFTSSPAYYRNLLSAGLTTSSGHPDFLGVILGFVAFRIRNRGRQTPIADSIVRPLNSSSQVTVFCRGTDEVQLAASVLRSTGARDIEPAMAPTLREERPVVAASRGPVAAPDAGRIRIAKAPWNDMVRHAVTSYPEICCGAMLGATHDDCKEASLALKLQNVTTASKRTYWEIGGEDLCQADRDAQRQGLELIGIYHSYPDEDAYFSQTDLRNSCPWYSYLVLSIQRGRFDHANSWVTNAEQTAAAKEQLFYEN